MEEEKTERYTVGQPTQAFVEAEWRNGLVISVKSSDVVEYGVTIINSGNRFYLTPESVRAWREVLLLAQDSFEDSGVSDKVLFQGLDFVEEINFSLLPSDDESLFITQSNPVDDMPKSADNSIVHDSLIGFAEADDARKPGCQHIHVTSLLHTRGH